MVTEISVKIFLKQWRTRIIFDISDMTESFKTLILHAIVNIERNYLFLNPQHWQCVIT